MKLTFLGTRGYIESRNRRHRYQSSTLVSYRGREVMIDCGEDWEGRIGDVDPDAVVLTHAHPDHAGGLEDGSPVPVWATEQTWEEVDPDGLHASLTLSARVPESIEGITFEAFPVDHSTRCPAVGYRVSAGEVTIFYVPDVVYIHDREQALEGCRLYVGDGATMTQSMVRKPADTLIGHTPMRTQLTWCEKCGVPEAVFTHCGSGIVEGDERTLGAQLRELAEERGVKASIAHDGHQRVLR